MLGSVHEELYNRVKALFDQDLDPTRGLNKSGSAGYCRGGMWRMGDPQKTKNYPHIEVRLNMDEDLNSADGVICLFTVELRIIADRDQKYEGNSGDVALNTVAQRVRELYNDCPVEKGTGSNEYRISSFKRLGGSLGEVTDKHLSLVDRYQVVVSTRDVTLFHVFNSASKTFYRGGFSREGRRFIALDVGDLEAPNNEVPHPGWADRLQIAQAVTRSRVFNKFDAEYVVTYKPLDFSFDQRQARVTVETDLVPQKAIMYQQVQNSTPEGTTTTFVPIEWTYERARYTRTEQIKKDIGRTIDTDPLTDLMNQIAADTNKIRTIDNVPYLFLGPKITYNTKTGIALISATFRTVGPVKAILPENRPDGPTTGLPALDWMQTYLDIPAYKQGTVVRPPAIYTRPILDYYEEGSFAWLNP